MVVRCVAAVRVWWAQDDLFNRPRTELRCRFWSQAAAATPRTLVQGAMYKALVGEALSLIADPPSLAGFDYELLLGGRGLDLIVSGYSVPQLLKFTDMVASALQPPAFGPTQQTFQTLKDELMEGYTNLQFWPPHKQASSVVGDLLQQPSFYHGRMGQLSCVDSRVFIAVCCSPRAC